MELLFSIISGFLIGWFFSRKKVEGRMIKILKKCGKFDDNELDEFLAYYRNYETIQKETDKKLRDLAMKTELDYRLRSDRSQKL